MSAYLAMTTHSRSERHVHIAEEISSSRGPAIGDVFPLEGINVASDLSWKKISYDIGEGTGGICVMGLDALEATYGPSVIDGMHEMLNALRANDGVFIAIAPFKTKSLERFRELCSVHIRIDKFGDDTILWGEAPFTSYQAVEAKQMPKGIPLMLTPIFSATSTMCMKYDGVQAMAVVPRSCISSICRSVFPTPVGRTVAPIFSAP
jgi:hypothetical protein